MKKYDYVVVGGGIIGLSVALALVKRNRFARIAVLEKEPEWARHQTGRNSGVIHSGIYYRPGSLKAQLCQEGNSALLEFCREHEIPHELCGKLIVATCDAEKPLLESLHQRGVENGLNPVQLNAAEAREIEPNVACMAALHVRSTGIVDYGAVCKKIAELLSESDVRLSLGTMLVAAETLGSSMHVQTNRDDFETRYLINCSGLHSDRVAHACGANPPARIIPFRGEYYELKPERRSLVKHLIYPVPNPEFPFLGVHFTRMIDGSVHAGPNAVLSLKREGYHRTAFDLKDAMETLSYPGFWRLAANHLDEGVKEIHRSFSKAAFVKSLAKLIPEIRSEDLIPSEAGVRAQALSPDGKLVDDFLFLKTERALHVCNAPSPAATASFAIAKQILSNIPDLNS